MENFKKAMIIRGGNVIGAVGDKNFSTLHIGCVIPFAGNTDNIPRGYLACDGASYPTTEYPELYAVIGNTYGGDSTNFNVPDYRETVLVGVGENTTDTIADHDVYALGEFKDDQFQGHWHNLGNSNGTVTVSLGASIKGSETKSAASDQSITRYMVDTAIDAITDGTNGEPRKGTTTHGKQKGVTYIIKAFHTNEGMDEGVSDDVVEYVDNKFSSVDIKTTTTIPAGQHLKIELGENKLSTVLLSMKTTIGTGYTTFLISNYGIGTNERCRVQQLQGERKFAKYIDGCNLYITPSVADQVWYASAIAVQGVNPVLSASETYSGTEITTNSVPKEIVDGLISDTTSTTSTWSSSKIDERFTSTYLIKDIAAGGENEKTVSFKVRKEYLSQYYAKRTFLLSANIYSLGFSKPVIGLVEIFRGSADNYGGYVVNLQDSRYTGVTVTVNGDYLEVVVTFNSYESSGCMVSCSSLSNVPIA